MAGLLDQECFCSGLDVHESDAPFQHRVLQLVLFQPLQVAPPQETPSRRLESRNELFGHWHDLGRVPHFAEGVNLQSPLS